MGQAVGLGEISTYSALNQPLNAQIEMVSTSPDEVGGITVKLAPESVFEQVGITRSPVLNYLRFKPAVVNGAPVIKVSSDRPIQEPFLNFIVEVSWPKGKLLREYTVLLDPPVLGGGAPAPATTEMPADIAEVPIFVSEPEAGEAAETTPLATAPVETAEPVVTTEVPAEEGLPPFTGEAPADLETFTVTETPEAVVEEVEVVEEPELLPVEEPGVVTTAPVADLEDTENWLPPFVGGAFDSGSADIETYAVGGSEPVAAEEGVETAPTGDTYQVARGDTLFGIARRAREGTAANIYQMMVAIHRGNPSAFIRNDMNRLKAGYILRMPDPAEAASIDRGEAKAAVVAAIASQGGAFQQFKSQAAKTAVPQTPAPATPEPVAEKPVPVAEKSGGSADLESGATEKGAEAAAGGAMVEKPNLEILTPEGKGDNAAGGEAGEGGGTATSAALVKEQLESKARESEELASRAAELESMIADKDRLIELKDEKLADLQSEVAGEPAGGKTAAATEETASDDGSSPESTEAETQTTEAGSGLTESEKAAEPVVEEMVTETEVEEEVTPENTSLLEEETTDEAAGEAMPESGDEEATTPPEEQDESTGVVDSLMANPGALAGVGAGVLLMSALAWLIFRRKEEEPVVIGSETEEVMDDAVSVGDEEVAEELVEDDLSRTAQVSAEDVMVATEHAGELLTEEEEEPGTLVYAPEELATGDEDEVLSETNVYLSYGLHDQAIDLLKPAVEAHPERNDYIAKLAEAYYAAGDKEAFIATAQKMHGPADGPDKELFQRVAVMGKDIAPEHEMFVNADTGDLTLTAIMQRPEALTETNISETVATDVDDIDITPDDTQLPDLDELSKSLQMEESEALQELRESAMELEEASLDATSVQEQTPMPDFGEIKDEAVDDVREGFADLSSAPDESVAQLNTRTVTMVMSDAAEDLSLDELEDDFNSLTTGADEISTKLDLAKAYIDMGDDEGAREALEEVIASGNEEQQNAARKLLEQLQ